MEATQTSSKKPKLKLDFKDSKYATGRRKTSIAKVWLKKGSGKIYVNGKLFNEVNFASSSLLDDLTLDDSDFHIFDKWGDLSGLDSYKSIPSALKIFIEYIENYLGIPINIISFGPDRNETIIK